MQKLIVGGVDLTRFLGIPYIGPRHPGNVSDREFYEFLANPNLGGNCELCALGVAWATGFYVELKRAIELWHDKDFTLEINEDTPCREFDILFFLPKGVDPHKVEEDVAMGLYGGRYGPNDFKKFHLGVYIGKHEGLEHGVLHLPKPGPSTIWDFSQFERCEKEYWLFKVKRPFKRRTIE